MISNPMNMNQREVFQKKFNAFAAGTVFLVMLLHASEGNVWWALLFMGLLIFNLILAKEDHPHLVAGEDEK